MIKLIILIILLTLLITMKEKEHFMINLDLYIKNYGEIQNYFRNCLQKKGHYSCIRGNPYKMQQPFKKYMSKLKRISYSNSKKTSHLLPVKL
jgi:hypothetical protein